MMKTVLKIIVAGLFLAAIAGLLICRDKSVAAKPLIHRTAAAVHIGPPVFSPMPEILLLKGWKCIDFSQMPSLNITQAQSNEVANALAGVIEAYTNGQIEAMQEKITQLPEYLTAIEDHAFRPIMSPIWCKVRDFTDGKQSVKWSKVSEFSDYMEIGLVLTRFACDLECERVIGSEYAKYAEYKLLRQMQDRLKEFRRRGQVEFEQKMQKYINDWIAHIETKDGYARRYAWIQISLQYEHITEGSWTVGQLFQYARMQAAGLVRRCNYRPRWLDEDFPLPEGMKDVWERPNDRPVGVTTNQAAGYHADSFDEAVKYKLSSIKAETDEGLVEFGSKKEISEFNALINGVADLGCRHELIKEYGQMLLSIELAHPPYRRWENVGRGYFSHLDNAIQLMRECGCTSKQQLDLFFSGLSRFKEACLTVPNGVIRQEESYNNYCSRMDCDHKLRDEYSQRMYEISNFWLPRLNDRFPSESHEEFKKRIAPFLQKQK